VKRSSDPWAITSADFPWLKTLSPCSPQKTASGWASPPHSTTQSQAARKILLLFQVLSRSMERLHINSSNACQDARLCHMTLRGSHSKAEREDRERDMQTHPVPGMSSKSQPLSFIGGGSETGVRMQVPVYHKVVRQIWEQYSNKQQCTMLITASGCCLNLTPKQPILMAMMMTTKMTWMISTWAHD